MRKAFTLIELMVVITIIGILAGLMFGAVNMASEASKRAATKATITKLNSIVMERYESYLTRRVPISTAGKTPLEAARMRLDAIRDLMRMEMPDAKSDVVNGPIAFSWGSIPEPPLHRLYASNPPTADHDGAQALYMFVSRACPEAMGHFSQKEVGSIEEHTGVFVDGKEIVRHHPVFVDGYGRPIMFLRWAPGYRSPIQSGDEKADHDPFDPRQVDGFAFRLVPLIYSAGPDGEYGIGLDTGAFGGNPYAADTLGKPLTTGVDADNITNHVIETR